MECARIGWRFCDELYFCIYNDLIGRLLASVANQFGIKRISICSYCGGIWVVDRIGNPEIDKEMSSLGQAILVRPN
jgi:hypothetical protein